MILIDILSLYRTGMPFANQNVDCCEKKFCLICAQSFVVGYRINVAERQFNTRERSLLNHGSSDELVNTYFFFSI